MGDTFLTVKQVAELLHRSRRTVYRWIDEGYLKNLLRVKDGWLIRVSEIQKLKVDQKHSVPEDDHMTV